MDVIGPLAARGLVIAPDLPGSGRSRPARRGAGNTFADAQFLDDFTMALGIERKLAAWPSVPGVASVAPHPSDSTAPSMSARLLLLAYGMRYGTV